MPKRSSILQLPEEIRDELNRRLVANSFSGYQGFSDWLGELGFEISRSSVHRHGQQFEEKLAAIKIATEQARAIADAAGDEEGKMNDALIRLIQQKAFDTLVDLQEDKDGILPKMGIMVARLSRASVGQKKWQAEVRGKAREAARKISKELKKRGLSEEAAEAIKKDILGIAG